MIKLLAAVSLALLSGLSALPAQAFCFNEAGARYQVDPRLLKAIARQESELNPRAIGHNRNEAGKIISSDYGLMQINSDHVPKLVQMGVLKSRDDLLNNPCLNVQIGAWVMATHLKKCGVNWSCLGSYNAGFKKSDEQEARRMKYARDVYQLYQQELAGRAS